MAGNDSFVYYRKITWKKTSMKEPEGKKTYLEFLDEIKEVMSDKR